MGTTLVVTGGLVAAAALWTAVAVRGRSRGALSAVLVAAAALIAVFTLLPTGSAYASVNLDPGAGLAPWRSPATAVNVLGNLLLFVPLGVLLPARFPTLRPVWALLPVAAAVSVAVEVTQYAYVPGRAADVDDVLLNTAGAVAGLLAYRLVRLVSGRRPSPAGPRRPGRTAR